MTHAPATDQVPAGSFRFVALDVETANIAKASICQIGIACIREDGGILTYTTLIDPEDAFDSDNIRVHGIDAKAVRGAPRFPTVLDRIGLLLSRQPVVQHSDFDRLAIADACTKYGLAEPTWQWKNSLTVARRAWPGLEGGHGLRNLKAVLGLDFIHHDAGEDAWAAAQIVFAAERETGLTLDELAAPRRRAYPPNVAMAGAAGGRFTGEVIVFTGNLTIPRESAAMLAAEQGMAVASGVTSKTTILVVGAQDTTLLAGRATSSKHRKALEQVARGQRIQIIAEVEFLAMIGVR